MNAAGETRPVENVADAAYQFVSDALRGSEPGQPLFRMFDDSGGVLDPNAVAAVAKIGQGLGLIDACIEIADYVYNPDESEEVLAVLKPVKTELQQINFGNAATGAHAALTAAKPVLAVLKAMLRTTGRAPMVEVVRSRIESLRAEFDLDGDIDTILDDTLEMLDRLLEDPSDEEASSTLRTRSADIYAWGREHSVPAAKLLATHVMAATIDYWYPGAISAIGEALELMPGLRPVGQLIVDSITGLVSVAGELESGAVKELGPGDDDT